MQKGFALIVSAPSGTGKTTLIKVLRENSPDLKFSISHTTRKIRDGEKDGKDYFFTTKEDFKKKIKKNEFLEWAEVHGQYYGTSLKSSEEPLKSGHNNILELDIEGVKSLRKMEYPGIYIIILPPSMEELERRLRERGTETEQSIKRRMENGRVEIKSYKLYDYVLTNNVVEDTVKDILAILSSERNKVYHYRPTSSDIKLLLKDEVN
jgi:guanylate kinase